MKIRALLWTVLLVMVLSCSVNASELDPKYDWDNMDWEQFEFSNYTVPELDTLWPWLSENADDALLVSLTLKSDASFATWLFGCLSDRFMVGHEDVLQAIASVEESSWKMLVRGIIHESNSPEQMKELIFSITLPDTADAGTKAALQEMIAYAEEFWEMTPPQTGDPVGVIALLMALSGIGTGAMIQKRRA